MAVPRLQTLCPFSVSSVPSVVKNGFQDWAALVSEKVHSSVKFLIGDRVERSGQTHCEYRSLTFPAPSDWRRQRSDGAPSVSAGYAGATRRYEVARYH